MKVIRVAVVVFAGISTLSSALYGQTAQKPSPYTGVSQPPPDDTITTDEASPNAKPVVRPNNLPAVAASASPATAIQPSLPDSVSIAQPGCNVDDRMIGDPSPCGQPVVDPANAQTGADSDAGIVTYVPSNPGELPEGTIIRLTLDQALSTGESQPGSDFSGRVNADVIFSGKVAIPQGSQIVGKIVRVTEGHRFGSPATIRIRPDVVVLPDGSRYVLRAAIIETSTRSRIDSEGALKPASRIKTNVIQETAGIGTGAVAGALIGGGPGALVGGLIGAGVMTTHIVVQHPASVNLPKDSTLTLSLTQPMSIAPQQQNN